MSLSIGNFWIKFRVYFSKIRNKLYYFESWWKDTKSKKNNEIIANAKVKDEDQPKLPWAASWEMFIAPMIWYGPTVGVRNTLLPQLFSQIDPVHEVWAYGILGAVATLVSAITNLLFGALSDVTRSRWGKRRPYIVWGTIVMALSLIVVANPKSGGAIIIVWIVDATAENAIAASIYPQISDWIAPK